MKSIIIIIYFYFLKIKTLLYYNVHRAQSYIVTSTKVQADETDDSLSRTQMERKPRKYPSAELRKLIISRRVLRDAKNNVRSRWPRHNETNDTVGTVIMRCGQAVRWNVLDLFIVPHFSPDLVTCFGNEAATAAICSQDYLETRLYVYRTEKRIFTPFCLLTKRVTSWFGDCIFNSGALRLTHVAK